jgi:hypothetical protein
VWDRLYTILARGKRRLDFRRLIADEATNFTPMPVADRDRLKEPA